MTPTTPTTPPSNPGARPRLLAFLGSGLGRVVTINVVLLTVLVSMTIGPGAGAQPTAGASRARGEYMLLAGKTNTGNTHAIYVLDAANQEMVSVRWDASHQKLVGMGYRNLDADAKAPPTR